MAELLSLTRAARLVGVSRGALQKRIKDGEIRTFEGLVSAEELLRAYPRTRLEDDPFLERLAAIKEQAFAGRLRERILPDPEVLMARLGDIGAALAAARDQLGRYQRLVSEVQRQLDALGAAPALHEALAPLRAHLWQGLEETLRLADTPDPLMVKDSLLRIMAAQVRIRPSGHEFFVEGSDSLLEAALRAGLSLNYGCSNGACGLCKAQVVSGQVKKLRAHDYTLSEAERAGGTVLMCSVTAVTDLVIEAPEAGAASEIPVQRIPARVRRIESLNSETLRLYLQTPRTNRLRFLAGQSVRLEAGGSAADYPVASCPCDDRNLEFHIRRDPADPFAARALAELRPADVVTVEGPRGEFVLREDSTRPLLFVAIEHGFAPIKSLIEHAMALDTAESIDLRWIASSPDGHYLQNLCRSWADALDDFEYTGYAPESSPAPAEPAWPGYGNADGFRALLANALNPHPSLTECDVYLAGPRMAVDLASAWLRARGLPPAQLRVGAL